MFGLEKQPDREKFAFALEKEIQADPHRRKAILDEVEKRMQDIKKELREGANKEDFDQLGILLHGYAALQKVLRKVK